MAELLARKPLFAGLNEMNQLDTIFKTVGTPTEESWPGLSLLPLFKKFKFMGSPHSTLRQRFPAPAPVFDGRPSLSDAGFHLLSGLLTLCPVSFCILVVVVVHLLYICMHFFFVLSFYSHS